MGFVNPFVSLTLRIPISCIISKIFFFCWALVGRELSPDYIDVPPYCKSVFLIPYLEIYT